MDEPADLRQQQARIWGAGDYRPVGRLLAPAAERLVDAAGMVAGQRVLDLGVGSGEQARVTTRTFRLVLTAMMDHERVRVSLVA